MDAEEAIAEFRESDRAKDRVEALYDPEASGFTFPNDLDPEYNLADKDYWLVGLTSENYNTDEIEVGVEEVADFYEKYGELFEEYDALKLGGFNFPDEPKISVDLSVSVESREEAVRLGGEMNQHSVFTPSLAFETDFEKGSVETGGDGDPVVSEPEEIREVLADIGTLTKHLRTVTMKDDSPEPTFVSEDGDRMSASAIAHGVPHGALEAEPSEDGFLVNGTLYREEGAKDDTAEKMAESAVERIQGQAAEDDAGN